MVFKDVVHQSHEDRHIEHAVRDELALSLDVTDRRLIDVAVEHGVVNLTGFVDSYARKWAAERAAVRVVGVRDLRNYVDVLPPQDPSREDRRIRRAAKRVLEWDARVPRGVDGDVTNGVVRLHGNVERFSQREAAEEAVRNLIGVRDVVNEIRVAPAPLRANLENDVAAVLRRRFRQNGDRVVISSTERVVTLSGIVPSFAMLEEIERTVRSIPGVSRIDNQLVVD